MEDLGWNRWHADLATYLKASKTGAIVVGDLGTATVGHILAAIYENKTGWIGLFVVRPPFRGRSYGKQLLDTAMDQFETHDTEVVGLDSVIDRTPIYKKRGFIASPLGKIRCMSFALPTGPKRAEDSYLNSRPSNLCLVEFKEIPCEVLSQSDFDHTGFRRDDLWNQGIRERADFFGTALVEKEKPFDMESLHGWAAVRQASEGFRLGPVYARNSEASRMLIREAVRLAMDTVAVRTCRMGNPDAAVSMVAEVWGGNQDAVASFEDLGWECTGVDYHRMWLGGITTTQQSSSGLAQRGMFAIFDAAVG